MSDQIPLPTVDQFTAELHSVGPKWYDLGVFFGVAPHELDTIGKYHGSEGTQRCLIELYKCFQTRSKPLSWNDITDALTKIHNNYLADCIREKYIQTASSSYLSSPPPGKKDGEKTRSDSQVMETSRVSEIDDNQHIYIDRSISREFNEISTSFTSLVLKVKQALQRKSVSIDDLQVVLQDQCKLEPLSGEVATLDKVFARICQHYCFLNYSILAYLVDMFLKNQKRLQQLFADYTNMLEKFKESVMVKDLMKLIKEKRDLYGNHKIIGLKTRDFWGKVPLNKFERLAKLIFENLYDCAAQIRIEDGCMHVTWVLPYIDTSVLVTVSPNLLKALGVISLKIDDKVLYEGPNEGCHILESAFMQAVELGNIIAVELLLAVGCDISVHAHTGELAITSALKLRDSEAMAILHLACLNGHTDVVHTLLEAGSSPEVTTNELVTPLMMGSWYGHNEVVELLLKAKVNLNACLKDGTTAIHIASENGHSVVISTLLTFGADPNLTLSDGWTPLMIGSQKGHNGVAELLLKAKVNPNVCLTNGTTAIYIASQNGQSMVVSTLLTSGADPNAAKSDGWTPLLIGSQNGHNEVVELLLKAKGNPNASLHDGTTAIFIASQNDHSVVVSTLLTSGADPNMAKWDGWTPLMIGSWNGHNEVVELLLKAEVNPNVCLKDGATAIYIASQNGHSVVVSTLLASFADPNMAKWDGWTPLMIGSQRGHNKVVEVLLKAKVDPNACNKNGVTAIYIASQNGCPLIISTLLKYGANPNIGTKVNGWTPLLIASRRGHTEAVKQLIEHGAININYQAVAGITALHLASRYRHIDIVRILLEVGADSSLVDSEGKSPLTYALKYGHYDIVTVLNEFRLPNEIFRSISQLSLTSCDTTDTGYSDDNLSFTTELSDSWEIEDDLVSLDNYETN